MWSGSQRKVVIHFPKRYYSLEKSLQAEALCANSLFRFHIDSLLKTRVHRTKTSNIVALHLPIEPILFHFIVTFPVLLHAAFSWCEHKSFAMNKCVCVEAIVSQFNIKHETMYCKLPILFSFGNESLSPIRLLSFYGCCFPAFFNVVFVVGLVFCFK